MNGFYMAMRGNLRIPRPRSTTTSSSGPRLPCRGRTSGARCWAPRTPPRLPRVLCEGRSWTTGARSAYRRARTRATTASTRRRRPSRRFGTRELVRGVLRDGRRVPRGLVAAGVDAKTAAPAEDPQVRRPGGGAGSLFDALEDLRRGQSASRLRKRSKANERLNCLFIRMTRLLFRLTDSVSPMCRRLLLRLVAMRNRAPQHRARCRVPSIKIGRAAGGHTLAVGVARARRRRGYA